MTDTTEDSSRPTEDGSEDGAGSESGREHYKVAGDRVVAKLKEILHEGNVRHVVIKNEEGKTLIEIPVTLGVAGALLIPVWAAVGAVAAVVSKCTIEIERTDLEE
jgi:hypothetical protein